jgi:hypothetical protein
MPMAMLVVAAVLDAAMATPSTTPRERRRAGRGGGGADDMKGSSGDRVGRAARECDGTTGVHIGSTLLT